jgi:hypothetical protein
MAKKEEKNKPTKTDVIKKGGLLWFAGACGAAGLAFLTQGKLYEGIACLATSAALYIVRELIKKEE